MRTEYGRFYDIGHNGRVLWWMYQPLMRVTSNRRGRSVWEFVGCPKAEFDLAGMLGWRRVFLTKTPAELEATAGRIV